jgi:hypothetical protein
MKQSDTPPIFEKYVLPPVDVTMSILKSVDHAQMSRRAVLAAFIDVCLLAQAACGLVDLV